MQITIRKRAEIFESKWSGGCTRELFIFPQNSVYAQRNFQFRLSSATIEDSPSHFTKLPTYQRILMPLTAPIKLVFLKPTNTNPSDTYTHNLAKSNNNSCSYTELNDEHSCSFLKPNNEHSCGLLKPDNEHSCSFLKPNDEHSCSFLNPDNKHSCSFLNPDNKHSCSLSKPYNEQSCSLSKPYNEHSCGYAKLADKYTCNYIKSDDSCASSVCVAPFESIEFDGGQTTISHGQCTDIGIMLSKEWSGELLCAGSCQLEPAHGFICIYALDNNLKVDANGSEYTLSQGDLLIADYLDGKKQRLTLSALQNRAAIIARIIPKNSNT